MSNYRKEKNFIIINLDNASGEYRFDINTGILYGISGNAIKRCPRKREITSLFPHYRNCGNPSNLGYVLYNMFDRNINTAEYPAFVSALVAADKIDAIGINDLWLYNEQYEYIGNNFKLFTTYIKNLENIEDFHFHSFKEWAEFEKIKNSIGSVANLLTPEMYMSLIRDLPTISSEELSVCAYYLVRGKYWEYHQGHTRNLVDYIKMCRKMQKEPQKSNNFMREFCETKKEYELRKTEFDNLQIVKNYEKHKKAWEFEYGRYAIFIPTTAKDIIDEGSRMHHCVGSYVDRVVNNTTYICFVREKSTPNTPYITCQVHTNGVIGQYFLAYDNYISSEEDLAFKEAFARHLREVWGE